MYMDGYQLFLLLLAGYIVVLVSIGVHFNKRQDSMREFLLGGRRAGALAIGFSAAASWLTAGAMLAVVGFFVLLGMGSIWGFVAPNIIALLGIALLVRKIRSIPAMTQPELLEIRYGSFIRAPVALIITVIMILFAVADIKGFAMVLQVFYSIDNVHAAVIVGLSVAVYVSLGGLSAVIATDTIQYVCLASFISIMAALVLARSGVSSVADIQVLSASVDISWWNPLVIGMPMVLIFSLAIIPGWVSEQDPWQKVWAARDERSARNGMLLGALLVTLVFVGCAVISLGLNNLYPDIQELGFPAGMAQAEPALLTFITQSGFSDLFVALCAVALATAAMSCADTFATSGASCLARDIYQRLFNPSASMEQMLVASRLGVLLIIGCATVGSVFIHSIIEAIHIATFIASASYFFVLMGGIFWRRGTALGGAASLIVGFLTQCGFILIDLRYTPAGTPPLLESFHPLLMGHGVIVAMFLSGLVYIWVSLASHPSELFRLAPFFPDMARQLVGGYEGVASNSALPEHVSVHEVARGNMLYLRVSLDFPEYFSWREVVQAMIASYPHWISLTGLDSIRRCTRVNQLSCVSLTRGEKNSNGWLEIEGTANTNTVMRSEVASAYCELQKIVRSRTQ